MISCDYCGLPVLTGRKAGADGPAACATPQYCCFGCRFAAEVTRSKGEDGINRSLLLKLGVATFCTMNVVAFTMALWSQDFFPAESPDRLAAPLESLFRYLGLLFSLPVLFLLGQPLLENALSDLRRGVAATDLLVCIGVLAAYGFSAISVAQGEGAVYFEVGCVVLVLITLGRWFEAQGKLQATSALSELESLLPETARVLRHGVEFACPLSEIRIGDLIRVLPGERIPADGRVDGGTSHVDQQLLTGESWPVVKHPDDDVLAGSLAVDGELRIQVAAEATAGALSRLLAELREARMARGGHQRLADRLAAWFLPAVCLIALVAATWHGVVEGVERGVMIGLAVSLIACPCALGLATPLAVWTALGTAARRQVLFRSGEALERLAAIKVIAWDKTGTLTQGSATVVAVLTDPASAEADVVARAGAVAGSSLHPFSIAIAALTEGRIGRPVPPKVRQVAGRGLEMTDPAGDTTYLGSAQWMQELHLDLAPALQAALDNAIESGLAVVLIGWDGRVRGLFLMDERLRLEAASAIREFREQGIEQQLLTGDHPRRAQRVVEQISAAAAQVPFGLQRDDQHEIAGGNADLALDGGCQLDYAANLHPDEKVRQVQLLRARSGPVAMVGDGVNDAPALAASDVGIALRSGTDVSRDVAGVCLFSDDLSRLPWAFDFSRLAIRVIRQNLFWAFSYNAVGIGLACTGYLNPTLAAVIMAGSSLFVISNSLRLAQNGAVLNPPQCIEGSTAAEGLVAASLESGR